MSLNYGQQAEKLPVCLKNNDRFKYRKSLLRGKQKVKLERVDKEGFYPKVIP